MSSAPLVCLWSRDALRKLLPWLESLCPAATDQSPTVSCVDMILQLWCYCIKHYSMIMWCYLKWKIKLSLSMMHGWSEYNNIYVNTLHLVGKKKVSCATLAQAITVLCKMDHIWTTQSSRPVHLGTCSLYLFHFSTTHFKEIMIPFEFTVYFNVSKRI